MWRVKALKPINTKPFRKAAEEWLEKERINFIAKYQQRVNGDQPHIGAWVHALHWYWILPTEKMSDATSDKMFPSVNIFEAAANLQKGCDEKWVKRELASALRIDATEAHRRIQAFIKVPEINLAEFQADYLAVYGNGFDDLGPKPSTKPVPPVILAPTLF